MLVTWVAVGNGREQLLIYVSRFNRSRALSAPCSEGDFTDSAVIDSRYSLSSEIKERSELSQEHRAARQNYGADFSDPAASGKRSSSLAVNFDSR